MNFSSGAASFFAGVFLANAVPHFIHGISGDRFPTPFAKPPGKGLSSPLVNMLWALLNIFVGGLLFQMADGTPGGLLIAFAGAALIGVPLSLHFAHKDKG